MKTSSWIIFNFECDSIWIELNQHRDKIKRILLKPSDIGWTCNPFLFNPHISAHLTSQQHLPNIQTSKKKVKSDSLDFAQFKQPSGNPSSRGAKNSSTHLFYSDYELLSLAEINFCWTLHFIIIIFEPSDVTQKFMLWKSEVFTVKATRTLKIGHLLENY